MQIYQPHPHANVMPPMSTFEFESLKADILENGQQLPIQLLDNMILDGRHRFLACLQLGLPSKVETWTGKDSLEYVLSVNLKRRHLSDSQRALTAARFSTLPKGANQHTAAAVPSQNQLAKIFSVSTDSIQRGKLLLAQGAPAIIKLVMDDKLSLAKAKTLCAHSKNKQLAALKKQESEILGAAAEIKAKKGDAILAKRVEMIQSRIAKNKPLSEAGGPFSLIYADPPWRYAGTGKSGSRLRIENHYPTMAIEDICALPVASICDDDAMLFLWVPSSLIRQGFQVLDAWGFEHSTQLIWHKTGGKNPYFGPLLSG
jgi:ParB-like chromosome segregation protein Spo0J